jgi:AcrR family transcriptional regulator
MAAKRPVGRPPRIPDDVREAVVLSTATRLFASQGLHRTTMEAIATESGVRKPNLYRQFSSKEAAFVAVVERECDRLEEFLFRAYAASAGLPVEELASRSVGAIFQFAERHPDSFRVIFAADRPASPEASDRIGLALRRIADKIAQILRREFASRGVASETGARVLAEATVGMCVFAARRAEREGWDGEAVAQLIGSFLNAGLTHMRRTLLEALDAPPPPAAPPTERPSRRS